ncbi:hypothetical protein N3K66_005550 [Trichothecium roseum]|uniref:Uncharacterized protein n=1 Tax=Trichothecium roseum TaxID=47278 RepID=A0ACC0UZH0_9HYPO|nr:hypothetical protein N3K66_005550 [Trichothecium roseum]
MFTTHNHMPPPSSSSSSLPSSSSSSSSKVRSSSGCWTCRVRRKKCDEARPVCGGCRSLEITCHAYRGEDGGKPAWMDGGARQREAAERVKRQVRRQAGWRRDRRYMEQLEVVGTLEEEKEEEEGKEDGKEEGGGGKEGVGARARMGLDAGGEEVVVVQGHHRREQKDLTPPASDTNHAPSSSSASPPPPPAPTPAVPSRPDQDDHAVMVYLDYVFPYLFPYYRPPILSGGRGWVLGAIRGHGAVYHAVVSISTWFFGILTFQGNSIDHRGHRVSGHLSRSSPHPCKAATNRKMQSQLEMGLRELQAEVRRISAQDDEQKGTGTGTETAAAAAAGRQEKRLTVLQSILQMAMFEVAVAPSAAAGNWRIHLDAAAAVFRHMVSPPSSSSWAASLARLAEPAHPDWPLSFGGGVRMWRPPQAALRFFAANLLFMDIMAAVALGRAPRLGDYHASVIPRGVAVVGGGGNANGNEDEDEARMAMSGFVGLDNDTVQLLADVSSLAAWKRAQKETAAGTLDASAAAELQRRSNVLAADIASRIARLCPCSSSFMDTTSGHASSSSSSSSSSPGAVADQLLLNSHHHHHHSSSPETSPQTDTGGEPLPPAQNNHIWLRTVQAYLLTVQRGWHPLQDPDLRRFSRETAAELGALPRPAALRSLAFPYCLAGCLAVGDEERRLFRALASRLGALRIFGTLGQAADIMEAVWAKDDELVAEDWDVGKCLSVLGHSSLLI